jgi:VanZ family protein
MRLRTVETDPNGLIPYMQIPQVFTDPQKTHIVVTYDFKEQCVFIDGVLRQCDGIPKGDFANWDPDCRLVIGNEVTADRPWSGEIYYAAIYDQAVGGEEIAEKYDGGIPMGGCLNTNGGAAHTPPLICFPFDEKKGAWVIGYRDGVQSVRLHMPARLPMSTNMLQSSQPAEIIQSLGSIYNFLHILLFIPVGAFLYRYVGARVTSAFLTATIVLIFGSLVSLGFEMMQHFLPSRNSTIIDVVANLMGVCLGIAIAVIRMNRGHDIRVGG